MLHQVIIVKQKGIRILSNIYKEEKNKAYLDSILQKEKYKLQWIQNKNLMDKNSKFIKHIIQVFQNSITKTKLIVVQKCL